jgi:Rap1a immunity proteins
MRMLAIVLLLAPTSTHGAEVPPMTYFSGNDVYQWCQRDKAMAQAYAGGMYDMAAHGATVVDDLRHFGKDMPKNDHEVDFALERITPYCKADGVTLEQMTDVFCKYLKDNPAKRDGLPSIMFAESLKSAWPCQGK